MITVPVKTIGENYSADEFSEGVSQECQNTILESGLTLDNSGTNLTQQKEAILRYSSAGQQYVDSGSANSYNLNLIQSTYTTPTFNYFDGMIVNFIVGNTSTATSTINVNNLGVVPLVDILGNPVVQHTLIAGLYTTLRFDGGSFFLVSPNPAQTLKVSAIVRHSGATQTAGIVPTNIVSSFNISNIVSVENSGAYLWQVTYAINFDVQPQNYPNVQVMSVDQTLGFRLGSSSVNDGVGAIDILQFFDNEGVLEGRLNGFNLRVY